ncbi:MAG: YicC family protein [Paludibacteraceae bacterium]|nr:YicC family protein [Paludibacteraceae bacterium]
MILSMTGYGKAESQLSGRKLVCEIRSLNAKSMDLSVRLSSSLRARELDLRTLVTQRLERGKVDLALYFQDQADQAASLATVNWEAVRAYAAQYREQMGVTEVPAEVMATLLRMPEVVQAHDEDQSITDEEWTVVLETLNRAIDAFIAFRTQEGAALQAMFTEKLDAISQLLSEVEPFEKGRVAKIKERLEQNLQQLAADTQSKIDRNRLEQEMIYYLEKLDITEEKVRLTNHIRYFREVMTNGERTKGEGKQLGFIAQEMGREINTLGSKSNQSEMQILVVRMKDLLEQIKEQVLNVL